MILLLLLGRPAEEEEEEGREEVIEADLARAVFEVDGARSEDTSDSLVHVVQSLGEKIKLQNK